MNAVASATSGSMTLWLATLVAGLVTILWVQRSLCASTGEILFLWGGLMFGSVVLRRAAPGLGSALGPYGYPLLIALLLGLVFWRRKRWLRFVVDHELERKASREWIGTLEGLPVRLHPVTSKGAMGFEYTSVGLSFSFGESTLSFRRRDRPNTHAQGVDRYFEVSDGGNGWVKSRPDVVIELTRNQHFKAIDKGTITLKVGAFDGDKVSEMAVEARRLYELFVRS